MTGMCPLSLCTPSYAVHYKCLFYASANDKRWRHYIFRLSTIRLLTPITWHNIYLVVDFNETCRRYSSCEWVLLKRRSDVKCNVYKCVNAITGGRGIGLVVCISVLCKNRQHLHFCVKHTLVKVAECTVPLHHL